MTQQAKKTDTNGISNPSLNARKLLLSYRHGMMDER